VLSNVVAVINSKGGVFKSSISAQLAGLAAQSGWRTLVVEMDKQGNLSRDFGVMARNDRGAGLLRSVRDGDSLVPLDSIRPNLDYIPGGPETRTLYSVLSDFRDGVPSYHRLDATLATIAGDYDLVVIDAPPGEDEAQMAILIAAHFLLIPTKTDDGSIDGLGTVLTTAANIRQHYNPDLELLGVVLAGVGAANKRILSEARAEVTARTGGKLKVYDPPIRHAEGAATACRKHGLLVHELEVASGRQRTKLEADYGKAWWRTVDKEVRKEIRRLPDAAKLAEDYQQLVNAVLTDVTARLAQSA
jgi:chromosome partitioning protein